MLCEVEMPLILFPHASINLSGVMGNDPDAFSGGVKHGISDRRCHTNQRNFSYTF